MRVSQLDRAIASVNAERDEAWQAAVMKNAIFDSVINKLEMQKKPPSKKSTAARQVRKRGSVLDVHPDEGPVKS